MKSLIRGTLISEEFVGKPIHENKCPWIYKSIIVLTKFSHKTTNLRPHQHVNMANRRNTCPWKWMISQYMYGFLLYKCMYYAGHYKEVLLCDVCSQMIHADLRQVHLDHVKPMPSLQKPPYMRNSWCLLSAETFV